MDRTTCARDTDLEECVPLAPVDDVNSQWDQEAHGMGQYTSSWTDYILSFLIFFALLPLLLVLFFFVCAVKGFGCFGSPLVTVQRFAMNILTGKLRHTYLSVLLLRVCGVMDSIQLILQGVPARFWIETMDAKLRKYYKEKVGSNVVIFSHLRVGSYDKALEIILDPKRHRTRAFDGWISGFAPHKPNLPLFFNTGSAYHTAFRKVLHEKFTGRPNVLSLLEEEGAGLAKIAGPIVDDWLSTCSKAGEATKQVTRGQMADVAHPVVVIIMKVLFEVDVPKELLTQLKTFMSMGVGEFLLPVWTNPLNLDCFGRGVTLLKEFLLKHCNAERPDSLQGVPIHWKDLAAEFPGFLRKRAYCGCPFSRSVHSSVDSTSDDGLDAFVETLSTMMCTAAFLGTTTGLTNVLNKFVKVQMTWSSNSPLPWQDDVDEMARLYAHSPIDFILEALRLDPPVGGTHKVLTEEMRCPFMHKETTFPKGTIAVANLFMCHLDETAFGEDTLAFKPGRAPRDRYLMWNGPYGGSAPRHCPGEQLAMHVIKVCVDAFLTKFGKL